MSIRAWLRSLLQSSEPRQAMQPGVRVPQAAQAEYAEGLAAYRRGQFAQAVACFGRVVEARHDDADAHNNLGLSYLAAGSSEEAIDEFVLALHFRPGFAQAFYNLALGELARGNYGDALRALEQALTVKADYAAAHNALGYLLTHRMDDFARGAAHIRRALVLAPEDPDTLCNYSAVLTQEGRPDDAMAICEQLLRAHPDMHEARLNRGLIQLRRQRFREGWQDYEARKLAGGNYQPRNLSLPEWRGEPLTGKTLLIHAEQGIGDQIMFASCVKDVIALGAGCLLECAAPLEKLFARSFAPAMVIGEQTDDELMRRARAAGAGCQIALGSLPLRLRTDAGRFSGAPYLRADPLRIDHWRNRLARLGPGLKVGISWAGGAASTRGTSRSIPLGLWKPVLAVTGCRFVSLQHGEHAAQVSEVPTGAVHELAPEISDYDDTAALVCALDLVITVQTALLHLCGALGRPAWVLMQTACEWRYGECGESMPWYSSVRLVRQRQQGDWKPVIERIAHDLSERAAR